MLGLFVFSFSYVSGQMPVLSGPEQGSYYRIIADIENVLKTDDTKLIVNTESEGAAMNFEKLIDEQSPYKLALTQSDLLYREQALDMLNNTEKSKNIKVIVPLANEEIHLVTKKSSPLNDLRDFSDKTTIAIGNQYQGTYITSSLIKDKTKIFWRSKNTNFEDALGELHRREVDAFFIVGSAPLKKLDVNPQVFVDGLKLIPLRDFNGWAKHYQEDIISAGDYKWLEKDVPTFSVKTVLIVNEDKLDDNDRKLIAQIVEGLNTNMEKLKAEGHPKWKEIDLKDWDSNNWPLFE